MDPLERMRADLAHFVAWVGAAHDESRMIALSGVRGAIVPAASQRSVFNSVIYEDVVRLGRALPELAAAYDDAGVAAWTVWVPQADRDAARALQAAGHVLDADPLAMTCDLTSFEPPPAGDLDWTEDDVPLADVMALNDSAYPHDGTPFSDAFKNLTAGAHLYLARLDGAPASGLVTLERDGSAGIYWVATRPEARGRGLAGRLLGRALARARERGCTVSTLQATKMGAPVYERLGYRSHGALQMWERRRPTG